MKFEIRIVKADGDPGSEHRTRRMSGFWVAMVGTFTTSCLALSRFRGSGLGLPSDFGVRASEFLGCLLVICVLNLASAYCHAALPIFRAGAAMVDITPTNFPIRTAGNLTLTLAHKAIDPLNVRALVLDDSQTQIAIAVVDSCMVDRETMDAAKTAARYVTGIPVERMLISATHTHTAPAAYSCHGNDVEPAYVRFLIPRIAAAIIQAWRNCVPARVGWGKAECSQFVHCRRWIMRPGTAEDPPAAFTGKATNIAMMNPGYANTNKIRQTGPVDPSVTVLSLHLPDQIGGRKLTEMTDLTRLPDELLDGSPCFKLQGKFAIYTRISNST